jgi:hypothetical protein
LIFVLFSPFALLIAFAFLGWWRPLNAFSLGLVGATSSSCTWLDAYIPLDGLHHLVDMALTCTRVVLGCPGIPPDLEGSNKLSKLSFYHFIKA